MTRRRNNNSGYGPEFGRPRYRDENEPQEERFAPAFGKKNKKHDDEDVFNDKQYEYMKSRDYSSTSTWNTFDASTKSKNFSGPERMAGPDAGHESVGVWNSWGIATSNDEGQGDVSHLFVGTHEVMQQANLPQNAFEATNQSTLGLGSRANNIVNMIGSREIGTVSRAKDERLQYLDEKGQYKDGQDRGQIPKRLVEEYKRRIKQRTQEMTHANAVLNDWNSLTLEQQGQRREDARHAMAEMLRSLELVIEEEVPEEYRQEAHDTSVLIEDELPLFVDDFDREESPALTPSPPRPSRTLPFRLKQAQKAAARQQKRGNVFEDARSLVDSSYKSLTARARAPSRHAQRSPASSRRGSYDQSRHQSKVQSRRSSQSKQQFPPPPPPPAAIPLGARSVTSESSLFSVTNYPKILPPNDAERVTEIDVIETNKPKYWKAVQHSTISGRLVVVQLHKNLKFTFQQIASRVFGGQVQEFQFFPKHNQAVVAFLYPWEAQAFIAHVTNARKNDEEFRRLQVAAQWYKGEEDKSVFPHQENILTDVLSNISASRVLQVQRINRNYDHKMLEVFLKAKFANIVKFKLVVPQKNYEKEAENSNSIILEFSSLSHALDAYSLFNTNSLSDFAGSKAIFLSDPCSMPKARQPWCDCLNCTAPIAPTPRLTLGCNTPASRGTPYGGTPSHGTPLPLDDTDSIDTGADSMEFHSGRVVNYWGRNAVYLATKGNDEMVYDPEDDAAAPKLFDREWDKKGLLWGQTEY